MGPVTYDLLSLLRDETCITWPETQLQAWVCEFAQQLRDRDLTRLDNDDFWYGFNVMGAQRHLKVAGIFARLCYRDNKSHYLKHTPKTLRYLLRECRNIALHGQPVEVDPVVRFHSWLQQRVVPLLEQRLPQSPAFYKDAE